MVQAVQRLVQEITIVKNVEIVQVTLHHKVSPMSYLRNPATPVSITNMYKCLVSTFGYLYIRSVSWRIGHRQIST